MEMAMHRTPRLGMKLVSLLALAAALLGALLPAGQMPKLAGPCGKALCECPAEELPVAACSDDACLKQEARPVWTLQPDFQYHNAPTPGLAFHVVFCAQEIPVSADPFALAAALEAAPRASGGFALLESFREIFTPPPRA